MRKVILMILLTIVGSNAAGLTLIDSDETYTLFVDAANILKTRNRTKMWDMYDFKTAQVTATSKPYMSFKEQQEYDCKKEQTRTLLYSYHSVNMGGGEVVYIDNDPEKWVPVPPRAEAIWKIACGKR